MHLSDRKGVESMRNLRNNRHGWRVEAALESGSGRFIHVASVGWLHAHAGVNGMKLVEGGWVTS